MAIPQSQLETWAKQGSVTQSASTYNTVKNALANPDAHYDNRNFTVFLQGSYGNSSNIYAESDVDVVICYNGAFFHDLEALPENEKAAFKAYYSSGTYSYSDFKGHVHDALADTFGTSVKPGKKAIKVEASGNRRNSDVVVAFEFRRYHKFNNNNDQRFSEGICFFSQAGVRIANYPKQHSDNCTAKHQATNSNFKHAIRIFKNMRSHLAEKGVIKNSVAPSYFIEGLLYNVPNDRFTGTFSQMILNILRWLHQTTDKTTFVCANEEYYLMRDNAPECWPCADGDQFIKEAIKLWDNWGSV